MTGAPAVRTRELRKSYGDLEVLRGLDIVIPREEKVAIIGPSGSGKSTLLRLLMTLERPDSGRVELEGEPLWTMRRGDREVPADERHLRSVRAKVGMVFQQFNLFPHKSVLENLTLAPRVVQGTAPREAESRARELLGLVGLEEKADAYPAQLSGGQKQRVAIARALAPDPRILLFDEITSALDPELVGEVLEVLRRLALESRSTMLIVTHEMQFARDIANRVLFFDEGRVIEEGEPEKIFTDPTEQRTRDFLRAVLGG